MPLVMSSGHGVNRFFRASREIPDIRPKTIAFLSMPSSGSAALGRLGATCRRSVTIVATVSGTAQPLGKKKRLGARLRGPAGTKTWSG